MTPINFHGVNKRFGKPVDWDEAALGPCDELPVRWHKDGTCESRWRPSLRELLRLVFCGSVRLTIVGRQPAVALEVVR